MYEERRDSSWLQKKMALIESLTDDEKIQLYAREYPMILKCPHIPQAILQAVTSRDGTVMEQLHLLRNRFIGDDIVKIICKNTRYAYVREDASRRLYQQENGLQPARTMNERQTAN